jgi:hypothetical protein
MWQNRIVKQSECRTTGAAGVLLGTACFCVFASLTAAEAKPARSTTPPKA